MIGGRLISWYTPYTQNIQTTFCFHLLQFCYHKGKKVCLITQSVIDPQHTVNPTINILSAHAHSKGSGASQKVRYQWRVQGHPNTMHRGCYAASYMTFLALKRPSKERPWRQLDRCKMACFGWNTHPSFHGLLSAWKPFSLQESPLCSLRGASSCAGPGGQTWRNTCHSESI